MGAQKSQKGIYERVGLDQRPIQIDTERAEWFLGSFNMRLALGDGLGQPLSFVEDRWFKVQMIWWS
jgi:hypothetical protein